MGRKKIEIRPLTDERNRNVTFLKRKAGLMKKAWELSVLCGADVSILIFNANGKPFEFSSQELDGEIDRYLEFEGMMERRRAAEFAAAALADEDDDEDEDDDIPPKGGKAGPPKPGKSLKGKEVYKHRIGRIKSRSVNGTHKDSRRSSHHHVNGHVEEKRGFIDGILSTSRSASPSSGSGQSSMENRRVDRARQNSSSDMALQYAMNMQQNASTQTNQPQIPWMNQNPPQPHHGGNTNLPPGSWGNARPQWKSSGPAEAPVPQGFNPVFSYPSMEASSSGGGGSNHVHQYPNHDNFQPNLTNLPPIPGGWDQNMLTKYAEFQLQQNHQRQQRALLERQRYQLASLGVPVEEKSLLDDIFGSGPSGSGGLGPSSAPAGPVNMLAHGGAGNQFVNGLTNYTDVDTPGQGGEFIWPTLTKRSSAPAVPTVIQQEQDEQYAMWSSGIPQQQQQHQPQHSSVILSSHTRSSAAQDGEDGSTYPSPMMNESDRKRRYTVDVIGNSSQDDEASGPKRARMSAGPGGYDDGRITAWE